MRRRRGSPIRVLQAVERPVRTLRAVGSGIFLTLPFGNPPPLLFPSCGLYRPRTGNGYPARWTDGNAKLTVPLSAQDRLSAIRFSLVTFRDETTLGLLINNQPLFEGVIGDGSWSKEFSLSHLGFEAGDATIEIRSSTVKPPRDRRLLGVFIHEIRLSREREPGAR